MEIIDDNSEAWYPKLKAYPHFDAPISSKKAEALAKDPLSVKKHKFFPFLCYRHITKKFSNKKKKVRLILYAARKDSYIYSYYRDLLMKRYTPILGEKGLEECVIAYRRIIYNKDGKDYGKCNIHFANEAFEEIVKHNECIAIALDIKSFFESLNHNLIKEKWSQVLSIDRLSPDHYQVYKHITKYKVVDLDECYQKLGLMELRKNKNGKTIRKYKFSRKDQPIQLCTAQDFRTKIVGGKGSYKSLIRNNPYPDRGIPQGSPISDVISNIYMLEFDIAMKQLADKNGGYYRRYSDDILLIIRDTGSLNEVINSVRQLINRDKLEIKGEKTIIARFYKYNDEIVCERLNEKGNKLHNNKPNTFEYLGFNFDGKRILIRHSSSARYYKRLTNTIELQANLARGKNIKDNELKGEACINQSIIFSKFSFPDRRGRKNGKQRRTNFITYAKRAEMVINNSAIKKQIICNHKKIIRKKIIKAVNLASLDNR